ncbi:3-oxoadipate enol-lactonase [Paracoccus binzhouensis]|uniref:3-oxoadipate enol-lactonase n=1 Tax=Paracoccus binzhouensis TaxID=2796149 RepID=UPI0018EF11A6|nr:3-oxoadipate enol-lactonase [Paracoccus binzhouensis]
MPHLDLATHRLHYRIDGRIEDRPWLMFCNSLGTDLRMWDAQAAVLARDFRILRYDRRGHGLSGTPAGPYELADLGRDALALLDALGIARTHFCGLSIGGLVGQWLALHAGDRLDRIVLCATAARIGSPETWAARAAEVRANGLAGLVEATAERWFSPGFAAAQPQLVGTILARFAATSVEGYAGCCAALAGADLRDRLAGIAAPLLAISGAEDPVCPPADLQAIAAGVRHGRHLSLPGRHIVNLESAPAFNAALAGFLAGPG